jgi:5-methylcytosine-specific restriction endonuclease McrA
MINIKLFKEILERKENGYIEPTDKLNNELIEFFVNGNYSVSKIKKLFIKQTKSVSYNVEIVCNHCGKSEWKKLKKKYLFNYISNLRNYRNNFDISCIYPIGFCNTCIDKLSSKVKEINGNSLQYIIDFINKETNEYINNYLNPNNIFIDEGRIVENFLEISQSLFMEELISQKIKSMSYKDFLKTPYWRAISRYVIYNAGFKCQLCGSKTKLSVHHSSYKRHGYEHKYWKEDLIVLCDNCHKKYHNILEQKVGNLNKKN